jgi:hypothetical protein
LSQNRPDWKFSKNVKAHSIYIKEIRILLRKMRKYIRGPKITIKSTGAIGGQRNANNVVKKQKGNYTTVALYKS